MPTRPRTHQQRLSASRPTRRPRDTRESAARRGYGSRWRKYRALYLQANPLCRECERDGHTEAATVVDHVDPVSGPDDPRFWDPTNHQPLCASCHGRKTATEDGGFGNRQPDGAKVACTGDDVFGTTK